MRRECQVAIHLLSILIMLSSCSSTKYVPDGAYLLNKMKVSTEGEYRDLNTLALRSYVRQTPNQRWFSLFKLPLATYSLSGRDSSLWINRALKKMGEPPVIYDSTQTQRTLSDLTQQLLNEGFLNARVEASEKKHGKKHTIQAVNLEGIDGTAPKAVSLEVRDFGTMNVTIGGAQFAGSMGKYHVQSADVGGSWSKGGAKVYVDATSASLPAGALDELLPAGVPVTASGGKWKFAKAASVKWAKPKKGAAVPERYDAESGKGLVVDTSAGKTNLSAMKLTYTPKKGTFKGSFKVYALEGAGAKTKLKTYTVNVSGVVVGGVGYGKASCKNFEANWTVTVK